jgi:hypothetical protein
VTTPRRDLVFKLEDLISLASKLEKLVSSELSDNDRLTEDERRLLVAIFAAASKSAVRSDSPGQRPETFKSELLFAFVPTQSKSLLGDPPVAETHIGIPTPPGSPAGP